MLQATFFSVSYLRVPSTMSKKRKAEGLNSISPRKISPNAISTVPLSAFAAAKAKAQNGHLARLAGMGFHEASLETSKGQRNLRSSKDAGSSKLGGAHDQRDSDSSPQSGTLPEGDKLLELNQRFESEKSSAQNTELEQETITKQNIKLSSWTPTSTNIISRTTEAERLHLTYGQTLTVLGYYKLKVLNGLVTILGAFLTPSSMEHEVLTTSVSALPSIKCISSAGAEIELFHIPSHERHLQSLQQLSPLFENILHSSTNSGSFAKVLQNAASEMSNINCIQILESVEDKLKRVLLPLDVPYSWQQTINQWCDDQSSCSVVQICGPANSGKSTFARLLVNNWLSAPRSSKRVTSVAMLDLDPNKPEKSPPGQISLTILRKPVLDPSFARTAVNHASEQIVRAHTIGLNGYRENTSHYLEAVADLTERYRTEAKGMSVEQLSDFPLIVVCPAWYQGSGVDLNVSLSRAIRPSHLACVGESSPKVMNALQEAAGDAEIQVLQPQPYQSTRPSRTTLELHEMQLLSYFHSGQNSNRDLIWDPTPLSSRRPYHVSYDEESCEFAGIFIFGEIPVMYPKMLSTLLNGSLVSIIAIEDASAFKDTTICRGEGDNIPYFLAGPKGYTTPFDPKKSSVVGVALIRGIDSTDQTLQILTPIPAQKIAEIAHERLVLAFGALDCPGWAYTEDMYYNEGAKDKGKKQASSVEITPWVEEAGDDEGRNKLSGPAMQAWKTRRFH
jgi:polynucleotide 5'-hydroxyl-kinase GRC3/NOL9